RPVGRAVGGESIALADELDPVWGGERRVGGAGASAAGNGAADATDPARAGGDKDAGVLGVGREGLAKHDSGLGKEVGVLQADDTRDQRSVSGELLIDEVERVGAAVDVGSGAADGVGSVGDGGAAGEGDVADLALSPRRRQAGRGSAAAATSAAAHRYCDQRRGPRGEIVIVAVGVDGVAGAVAVAARAGRAAPIVVARIEKSVIRPGLDEQPVTVGLVTVAVDVVAGDDKAGAVARERLFVDANPPAGIVGDGVTLDGDVVNVALEAQRSAAGLAALGDVVARNEQSPDVVGQHRLAVGFEAVVGDADVGRGIGAW